MPLTNQLANKNLELHCTGLTSERKYFRTGNSFVKRSLRPSEWQVSALKGTIHVPRLGNERLLNEAAVLEYIGGNTDIPIPKLYTCFEDVNAVVLVTEHVDGVGMHELDEQQQKTVIVELDRHLQTLHSLKSCSLGGPTGIVVPPYRATTQTFRDDWRLKASTSNECVFCHNDLSQQNILVDPVSLRIMAILDWEYAGFFPVWFEKRFFERRGPSVALDGEEDDSERIVEFLNSQVCFVGVGDYESGLECLAC